MNKPRKSFGQRVATGETIARRYSIPRYVVNAIEEISPPYGSKGRAIQVGAELLRRIQFHPIPIAETVRNSKRGVVDAEEKVGMTYKLPPSTIEIIDAFSERYDTRGAVFEAIVSLLTRKFIA